MLACAPVCLVSIACLTASALLPTITLLWKVAYEAPLLAALALPLGVPVVMVAPLYVSSVKVVPLPSADVRSRFNASSDFARSRVGAMTTNDGRAEPERPLAG